MGKILDNPKAFFESMSSEEFSNLLDEFGFEYEELTTPKHDVDSIINYSEKINKQVTLSREVFKKYDVSKTSLDFTYNTVLKSTYRMNECIFNDFSNIYKLLASSSDEDNVESTNCCKEAIYFDDCKKKKNEYIGNEIGLEAA